MSDLLGVFFHFGTSCQSLGFLGKTKSSGVTQTSSLLCWDSPIDLHHTVPDSSQLGALDGRPPTASSFNKKIANK